jgi:hypothetical protein
MSFTKLYLILLIRLSDLNSINYLFKESVYIRVAAVGDIIEWACI